MKEIHHKNNKFKWPEHLGKEKLAKCGLQKTHQNYETQKV